ncbi:MAG: exosortase/archaeosortase family protein [Candidatus Hydrogenedentes bacterium]|nr:exosortase/archaeosortase family protein [Candidatus Hydrogenedentota bacterium]
MNARMETTGQHMLKNIPLPGPVARVTPRHLIRTAAQTAIGIFWVAGAAGAVWVSLPGVWDRWFQPWGSATSAGIFLIAIGMWLYLLTTPQRGVLRVAPASGWLLCGTLLLIAFAMVFARVPQLVSSEIAAAIVGCIMIGTLSTSSRAGAWGILVLMLLSIHVATSLDFFIGFPLRLVSSQFAGFLLGPNGSAVGAALTDGRSTFYVDAPCSGVRMLTASIAMGAAVSGLYQFNFRRTACLVAAAIALAIFGNAHRAATLFLIRVEPNDPMHEFIGIIVFVECALLLLFASAILSRWKALDTVPRYNFLRLPAPRGLCIAFVLAGALAAGSPALIRNNTHGPVYDSAAVEWPTTWNGQTLHPAPMPPEAQAWVRRVPGECAQFQLGDAGPMVMLRICHVPTRDLHSAQNCYLAMGGRCSPRGSEMDNSGRLWSSFWYTEPDGRRGRSVKECYFALKSGQRGETLEEWIDDVDSWPDVSAWYWAAALPGSNVRTTLALTVAE